MAFLSFCCGEKIKKMEVWRIFSNIFKNNFPIENLNVHLFKNAP